MRSERPLRSARCPIIIFHITNHHTLHPGLLSDIPTRLSGWFQHGYKSSATDLSLPHLINTIPPPSSSPKGKSSALLTAAKHGKGHLDKAMHYLLDSDSIPDNAQTQFGFWACSTPAMNPLLPPRQPQRRSHTAAPSTQGGQPLPHVNILHSDSLPLRALVTANVIKQKSRRTLAARIPCGFYVTRLDTYRSHFYPIRDSSLTTVLEREQALAAAAGVPTSISSSPPSKCWWPGGSKGWTSDARWGCMLRTGQSLLVTALIHPLLG